MKTLKLVNQIGCGALGLSCAAMLLTQLTASAQTLVHQYSFDAPADPSFGGTTLTTNVADSVGGPAWDGICMTDGTNNTPTDGQFNGAGQLLLTAASSDFVKLPVGVLSNYTAVTIDCWATFGDLPSACFLYGFGNTDAGGAGENYIFCQPQNGRIAITGVDPGWQGEQGVGGAGDLSGLTVHVTSVYNPASGYLELYTNGVLVARNSGITVPMSAVSNELNYIGRSLYTGDSYIDVGLDEFRIWDGALNGFQVAACDLNGPNNTNDDYGTVTGLQMKLASYELPQGTHEPVSATAEASGVASYGPVDITPLITLTTDNTNILTATNNIVYAVGQGQANVIASFGGISTTQAVMVTAGAAPTLMHRYSFATDASDSVGGAAWSGILNGNATIANGELVLPNPTNALATDYLQLPAGILTNNVNGIGTNFNDPAVTIEGWATINPSQYTWANLFDFGVQSSKDGLVPGNDAYSISLCVHAGNPANNTIAGISDSDDANQTRQILAIPAVLDGNTNMHIAVVFNPPAGYMAIYTNGVLMGVNTKVTISMAGIQGIRNIIGADNWPDPGLQGSLDEFRIWNGALSSQEIAMSDAAGPNASLTTLGTVTNGPGALESFTLNVASTLEAPFSTPVRLLANYANLTNFDILGNSIFPLTGLSITSSDTNVAYIGAGDRLYSRFPGVTTVTVAYQGVTNTATVTVVEPPTTATLVHRYSFNDANGSTNVADSVGGPAWDGVIMTNGTPPASFSGNFSNGQLFITSSNSEYVQLPAGIVSNYTAVSVDTWVTFPGTLPGNCALFNFGNTDPNVLSSGQPSGYDYIFCNPNAGRVSISTNDAGWQGTGEQSVYSGANWANSGIHVTAVVDSPEGYMAIYTNGVLAGINTSETYPLSGTQSVLNYIARSLYDADSYMNVNMDEFRIYDGVLSPADVAASQAIGPNVVLTTNAVLSATASNGKVMVSWPAAAAGFVLQSTTNLASGTWTTVSPAAAIVGNQWQTAVPASGGAQFFRLIR